MVKQIPIITLYIIIFISSGCAHKNIINFYNYESNETINKLPTSYNYIPTSDLIYKKNIFNAREYDSIDSITPLDLNISNFLKTSIYKLDKPNDYDMYYLGEIYIYNNFDTKIFLLHTYLENHEGKSTIIYLINTNSHKILSIVKLSDFFYSDFFSLEDLLVSKRLSINIFNIKHVNYSDVIISNQALDELKKQDKLSYSNGDDITFKITRKGKIKVLSNICMYFNKKL